jgi:hypothetical protein
MLTNLTIEIPDQFLSLGGIECHPPTFRSVGQNLQQKNSYRQIKISAKWYSVNYHHKFYTVFLKATSLGQKDDVYCFVIWAVW